MMHKFNAALVVLVLTAVATAPLWGDERASAKTTDGIPGEHSRSVTLACQRDDAGGLSVGEVLSERQAGGHPASGRAKKLNRLLPAAALLRQAVDYLATNEHQDWDRCAYDGVVLVDPSADFNVRPTERGKLKTMGLMFTFEDSRVVYVDVAAFNEQVLLRANGKDAVGLAVVALYHEYQHILGADEAAASKAQEDFINILVGRGIISSAWGEALHTMCTEQRHKSDFSHAKTLGLLQGQKSVTGSPAAAR